MYNLSLIKVVETLKALQRLHATVSKHTLCCKFKTKKNPKKQWSENEFNIRQNRKQIDIKNKKNKTIDKWQNIYIYFPELRPWHWKGKCYLFPVTCTIYLQRWTGILARLGFYRNLLFVNSLESPWGFSGPLLFVILCLSVYHCDSLREICIGWRRARWSFTSVSGVCGWCSRRKIISLLLNKQGHSCRSPALIVLQYISPKHHLCIEFVECHVCLVRPSLPFVSQLRVLWHSTLSAGSCGEEVRAGVPTFQQDVRSQIGDLRFSVNWFCCHKAYFKAVMWRCWG